MSVIVKVLFGGSSGRVTPHDGRYVMAWNSDSAFGTLLITSTEGPALAKRFNDAAHALQEWSAPSKKEPRRPTDGKPNCPLTAVTIEIVTIHD